jgi:hypothetical protein
MEAVVSTTGEKMDTDDAHRSSTAQTPSFRSGTDGGGGGDGVTAHHSEPHNPNTTAQ